MFKVFLYILGVLLISLGIFFTILDCNLLTMGYSFWDFVKFISRRIEFPLILIGFILLCISLERWIKNELLLRHHLKLERRRNL